MMMDFKEYRQKAREYQKNKCIIDTNIKILAEDGIFVEEWGETSGKLEIRKSMNTKEMKAIEDEFNVRFSLGGRKYVKFNFNEKIDGDYNPLMKEIRQAQKMLYDLYNGYFKEIIHSVYQDARICNKRYRIELGTKFWGFMVSAEVSLNDKAMSLDEIMAIEKDTDSTFIDYNLTTGYQFIFNHESD